MGEVLFVREREIFAVNLAVFKEISRFMTEKDPLRQRAAPVNTGSKGLGALEATEGLAAVS